MKNVFSDPKFHNEEAAFDFIESLLWPNGPICPHCGSREKIGKLRGKTTRAGLYKCYSCKKPFTVRIGTIFEDSHVPLRIWLQAMYLMAQSKKGISSNQLHRALGITLKSAWFLSHRIREAMRLGSFAPMGGKGGIVEADETFLWNDPTKGMVRQGYEHKNKILSLIDRNSGEARSMVIEKINAKTILPILRENIAQEAHLMTDEGGQYESAKSDFASHGTVCHRDGEYVSAENAYIHTNTVEGYFSIFKRGMRGVYQHCHKKHLHRYLAEFDFRYSNRVAKGIDDPERAEKLLCGVTGKRLTYQTTNC